MLNVVKFIYPYNDEYLAIIIWMSIGSLLHGWLFEYWNDKTQV